MDNQPKKGWGRVTWIFIGLITVGVIGAAAANNPSNNNTTATVPSVSQTANQYQQTQPAQEAAVQQNTLSNDNYYTNSNGNTIHSPAYSNSVPIGATARCGDGTYSFSQHRQGTCSHHGGVVNWF